MDIRVVGATDSGPEREHNEDAIVVDESLRFFAVGDGMGGPNRGQLASRMVVDIVASRLRTEFEAREGADGVNKTVAARLLEDAVRQACREIYDTAQHDADKRGMGTTFSGLLFVGQCVVLAHVGDSRIYLQREGAVHQLSTDHTLGSELVASGAMKAGDIEKSRYASALTRSVGQQPSVQVDTLVLDLYPEDRFLICSDGFSDTVGGTEELAGLLSGALDTLPEELIAYANAASGADNVSAVVVDVASDYDPSEESTAVHVSLHALSQVRLLRDLTLPQLQRLLNACQILSLKAGDVLIEPGSTVECAYVVATGRLGLSIDGRRLAEVAPGEVLAEASLIAPRRARGAVEALEKSRLVAIGRREFEELIRRLPSLGAFLLQQVAADLVEDLDTARELLAVNEGMRIVNVL